MTICHEHIKLSTRMQVPDTYTSVKFQGHRPIVISMSSVI